ncbi:MAG TPA: helix-turn-helix transcriptional regulator [Flavobacteriaceae bacterium]|nr:helix-turn-helix transcriptional regulator [Flavobacteriaceae bacterium]
MKNKPKIKLKILKEETGYTAVGKWRNRSLITCGDTWEELQSMIVEMVNLSFEDMEHTYTIDEIKFEYDLESFFDFYKVINAKALSERIGMSQSLLSQYTNGIKKPSANQTKRILKGVQQIGKELAEVRFLL